MSGPAVRIGVIGCGNFFSHIHEQTLVDLQGAGRCRVVAVCAHEAGPARDAAARLSAAGSTTDYRAVLADPAVDAVLVATPHDVQAEIALAAARAGKWVYVEKPLFADAADTGRPAGAFHADFAALPLDTRRRIVVGLNKRFAPAYRDLHALLRARGGLRAVQMSIIDDAWRWGAKYPPGFLMWLDACHWLDLARWLAGDDIAAVSCLVPQPEDAQVTLRLRGGAVASIFLSGNGTMDQFKEELRAVTAQRCCATVTDFVALEVYGGPRREVRTYAANRQCGGDAALVDQVTRDGVEGLRAVRRAMFERLADPAAAAYVRHNLPNFLRPQGWREAVTAWVAGVAAGQPPADAATVDDAYRAYRLLEATRTSAAADGAWVSAT